MNHMNVFNNFDDLKMAHENILTRSFLILLDTIPMYRMKFFELINSQMHNSKDFKPLNSDDLDDVEIKTQVSCHDKWFNTISNIDVVSVLIANEEFIVNDKIKRDNYNHIVDGIIKTANTLFIVENKPNVNNVWREQLNVNIKNDNKILDECCSIKWRDIISFSNQLLNCTYITQIEQRLIENFIEYIDDCYPELNPYDNFILCKDEDVLLHKRCCKILESLIDGSEVTHHKGWQDKIDSGNYIIPEIALFVDKNDENNYICLDMVAGDSMGRAKEMLDKINIDKLKVLLEDNHYDIYSCFHIAAYAKNLFYSSGSIELLNYVNFWKNELKDGNLNQVSREVDKNSFKKYYDKLVKNNIVKFEDYDDFKSKFIDKNYPVMNICPCIIFNYWWNKKDAFEMDKKDQFCDDVKMKMNNILDVFS